MLFTLCHLCNRGVNATVRNQCWPERILTQGKVQILSRQGRAQILGRSQPQPDDMLYICGAYFVRCACSRIRNQHVYDVCCRSGHHHGSKQFYFSGNEETPVSNGSRAISGSVSLYGLMVQCVCPSVSRNTPDPSIVVCRVKFLLSITKSLHSNPRSMIDVNHDH